ncbi:MAG: hypothetical protein WA902_02235 [Thermosynechococcaceae cyanobacterium]
MTAVWIVLVIALTILLFWLFFQPKQGKRAANAPSQSRIDAAHSPRLKDTPSVSETSPERYPSLNIEAEIRYLLASNQKIAAIKRVRQETGWGLKQAKDYIDFLSLPNSSTRVFYPRASLPHLSELEPELRQLMADGKKIAAIRRLREQTGWGLKRSKDYLESLPPIS